MLIFPIALDWEDFGKKLIIDVAKLEEAEEITHFFNVHLYQTSPTIHLLNWNGLNSIHQDTKQRCLSFVMSTLNSGPYSLTVRDETEGGQLVAVIINKIEDKPLQLNADQFNEQIPDRLLSAVLQSLNKDVDLWKLCETDRIFHFCVAAVNEKYGRRGLAMKLRELSIELAVQSGAGAIATEPINCNSVRGLTKLGFNTVKTLDYATFEFRGVRPLADNVDLY